MLSNAKVLHKRIITKHSFPNIITIANIDMQCLPIQSYYYCVVTFIRFQADLFTRPEQLLLQLLQFSLVDLLGRGSAIDAVGL